MKRVTSTRVAAVVLVVFAASCSSAPSSNSSVFSPGDENDPVVKYAALAANTSTVQITITNPSSVGLAQGIITFAPLYQVNTTASAALTAYLTGSSSGNARVLANASGLAVGMTAFLVPPIAAGATTSMLINAPLGSQLSYLARETVSAPDFVASYSPMSWPNGASGTFQTGFTLTSGGTVSRGNGSVGATPSIAVIAKDGLDCSANSLTSPTLLWADDFSTGAQSSAWPMNAGYDFEFNGDWVTDGITGRVWNPAGGNPQAPLPQTTGFVKLIDFCPNQGSTVSIRATVNTALLTSPDSDTTLVLYYFNGGGNLLGVEANYRLGRGNARTTTLINSSVPSATRRIAVVPMSYMAPGETSSVFYSSLEVSYAPKNTWQVTTVATDTLAVGTNGASGAGQPAGWAEFGGDYYVMSPGWVTLWNATWGGDQSKRPPIDTGIVKRFSLPSSLRTGDLLDASAFAAATFTDPTSFVRLRVLFNDANGVLISALDSDRVSQRSYANVELLNSAIPAGAKTIDVIVNAYLGPAETSSFYAKTLSVTTKRQLIY